MFIAALFTITKTWKQPKCPLTDEWIKKMCYIYIKYTYFIYIYNIHIIYIIYILYILNGILLGH